MQQIRTEELLASARQASQGGLPPSDLLPMIEAVHGTTQQTWQKFVLTATEDPEMPIQIRESIAKGLEDYLDSLVKMKTATEAGDLALLGELVNEAEACVLAVRAAQDEHKTNLSQGPTPFPYLNRMLIQYEAVRQGGDSQRLLALLTDGSSCLVWLRKELACRAATPADSQSVFHLQQFLEALHAAVESQQALPEVHDDIVDLALSLATALAEPPLEGPAGATPLPAINTVLQALSECSGEQEEFEFLLSVMEQSRNSLRALIPISSPPEKVQALNAVMQSLDKMEHALCHASDFEELVATAGQLESSANELGGKLADGQSVQFVPETEGLPLFFRSILEPVYLFMKGEGDADTVFAASEHLEASVSDLQRNASALDSSDHRAQRVQEALVLMSESAQMLRETAETGNPKGLEIATTLLSEAAGHIAQFS